MTRYIGKLGLKRMFLTVLEHIQRHNELYQSRIFQFMEFFGARLTKKWVMVSYASARKIKKSVEPQNCR